MKLNFNKKFAEICTCGSHEQCMGPTQKLQKTFIFSAIRRLKPIFVPSNPFRTYEIKARQRRSCQTHIFNQTNKIKFQIKISQKRNFELTGGFGGNMGKKSCNFFGSREFPVDVGSTKAIGLEVSRGSNKRLVVPECLICMALNLKGVTV